MARIKLLLRYDGTGLQGWQKQPHTDQTVQSKLETALSRLLQTEIRTIASGRTDAGTHALGQVVHFEGPDDIAKYDLVRAINQQIGPTIQVRRSWIVPDDFHAQRSAERKTYKYIVSLDEPMPMTAPYCWYWRHQSDLKELNRLSQCLLGEHDFASFQTAGTELATTVRSIYSAEWRRAKGNRLIFSITGSGFLKQMVRNIVGTLYDIDRKHLKSEDFEAILKATDRTKAGTTAPASGLFLFHVKYPMDLDIRCRRL